MDKDLKPCALKRAEKYITPNKAIMIDIHSIEDMSSIIEELVAMINTRATDCREVDDCIKASPAENYDDLKKQFYALKTIVNCKSKELSFYKDKDYKLSEDRLRELEASLESEREMNAQLTKELDDHLASRNLIRGAVETTKGEK